MADIIYCEWLKLKRSKITLIWVLGSFIVPFLVTVNDIRIALSNPAAVLSLDGIYEDTVMFLMLLFGPLVMAVVATFLVSREYTEKTIKTVFAVPIGRRQFLAGKFIMLFILVLLFMVLSWLDIVVISLLCGLFMHVLPVSPLAAVSLLNVVLSGSRVAGFYPWTAVYLLLTGRMAQSGCPVWLGILIIFSVCGFGIGASLIRFQKEVIG